MSRHNTDTSISLTLEFFWFFVPITFACGIWDLGHIETVVWYLSIVINILIGIITILRLTGLVTAIVDKKSLVADYVKGNIWALAMFVTWPTMWVGPSYFILLLINMCLLNMKPSKSS